MGGVETAWAASFVTRRMAGLPTIPTRIISQTWAKKHVHQFVTEVEDTIGIRAAGDNYNNDDDDDDDADEEQIIQELVELAAHLVQVDFEFVQNNKGIVINFLAMADIDENVTASAATTGNDIVSHTRNVIFSYSRNAIFSHAWNVIFSHARNDIVSHTSNGQIENDSRYNKEFFCRLMVDNGCARASGGELLQYCA